MILSELALFDFIYWVYLFNLFNFLKKDKGGPKSRKANIASSSSSSQGPNSFFNEVPVANSTVMGQSMMMNSNEHLFSEQQQFNGYGNNAHNGHNNQNYYNLMVFDSLELVHLFFGD